MTRPLHRVSGAAVVAAVGVFALSPAPSLAESGAAAALFPALAAAALVGLGAAPLARRTPTRAHPGWRILAAAALVLAVGAFVAEGYAQRRCTAAYDGRPRIIGTELTPTAATYTRDNPDLTSADLLFDAAGTADRVWTPASITRCRVVVSATHAAWLPFLVLCLLGVWESMASSTLVVPTPSRVAPGSTASASHAPTSHAMGSAGVAGSRGTESSETGRARTRYDAFLSYRHGGADGEAARQLLEALEARGYRVAIDERDFPANASFLLEMERCVRESRFTIAIVSARYLESDNCQEEAIICKVLDMAERKRRLIPVTIEAVAMPTWLYGIVGIDFTKENPIVDPLEKLVATLRTEDRRS